MVKAGVDGIDDLSKLVEPLKESGKRHISYGTQKEDYVKVLRTMVKTLREALPDFSKEDEVAWSKFLTIVAQIMTSAYEENKWQELYLLNYKFKK